MQPLVWHTHTLWARDMARWSARPLFASLACAAVMWAGVVHGGSFVDDMLFKGKVACDFRFFPDGHRVLVAEKRGRFRIHDTRTAIASGDTAGEAWIDLRDHVLSIESEKERGVLGFAFDPNFDTGSPYVYVLNMFVNT